MSTDLQSWRDEWYHALSNGNVEPGTRGVYILGVDQFIAWLTDQHPDVAAVDAVTKKHINSWMAHLTYRPQRPMKASTRKTRLLSVRMWFKYVTEEADSTITANPTAGIALPEPDNVPVPVLDDEDLAALLNACKGTRFVDYRDTFIVRFLLDTGCRRGELVSLDTDQIDRRKQEATVTGKTGTRITPFGGKTAIALSKYLRARDRHPAADSPALILSSQCKGRGGWRYTGDGLRDMVVRRAVQAGLGHAWPHMLRHTWASDMKANGVSNEDLEHLGGWSPNSPTVRVYGLSAGAQRARNAARRLGRGDRV